MDAVTLSYFTVALSVILLSFSIWNITRIKSRTNLPLPPCVPWIPVFGSLPFMSGLDQMHLMLTRLASRYGKVFSFRAGSRYTVVLNGYETIREALVGRATDFAGRETIFGDKLVINKESRGLAFSQYDDKYKYIVHVTMSILKDFGFGKDSTMEYKIHSELQELIKTWQAKAGQSFNPSQTIMNFTNNIIYRLVFSRRFALDDPTSKMLTDAIAADFAAGDLIFNMFPFLVYLPKYRKRFTKLEVLWKIWENFMKERIRDCNDTDENNFCMEFITRTGEKYEEADLLAILKDLIVAGTDTLHYQTAWILILLGNHPDVQEKVRQEVDAMVPRHRLPSLSDKQGLVYLKAVILEAMRLRTVIPLGLPHRTDCDTDVNGFFVPDNSLVFVNLWSAHMDPEQWTDPEEFRPERFLEEGNPSRIINKQFVIPFSLGKRACSGAMMARQELFLLTSSIVQRFDILPPEGQERITYEEICHIINGPENYALRLVPRHD